VQIDVVGIPRAQSGQHRRVRERALCDDTVCLGRCSDVKILHDRSALSAWMCPAIRASSMLFAMTLYLTVESLRTYVEGRDASPVVIGLWTLAAEHGDECLGLGSSGAGETGHSHDEGEHDEGAADPLHRYPFRSNCLLSCSLRRGGDETWLTRHRGRPDASKGLYSVARRSRRLTRDAVAP
jgi:hypothetical protein